MTPLRWWFRRAAQLRYLKPYRRKFARGMTLMASSLEPFQSLLSGVPYIMYDDNAVRNSLSALLDPRRRRRGRCRPSANASVFVVILACSDKSSSMRYENGHLRIAQNPLGKATKNPLALSTMAIAAHHQ